MILSSAEQIRKYTENGFWGSETIADLFLKCVRADPWAVAVVDPPNRASFCPGEPLRMTYVELAQAVDRLAGGLLEAGIKKDDIVMVQLPNIVELVIVYLAAARIGAILSPLAVQYRTHELRQVLALADPVAVVTTTDSGGFNLVSMVEVLRSEFPGLKTVIALGPNQTGQTLSLHELIYSPRDDGPLRDHITRAQISANDIFTLCWTSGTEAEPKGVPRSHNHWIWIAYASVDGSDLIRGHTLLNPFPLISMAGIGGMLVPWLLTGGKLVLHQPLSLAIFLGQIVTEKVEYTVAPPALLTMLLMKPDILKGVDLSALRSIGSGAAPLSAWMVSEWEGTYGIPVINIFGSNEGASFTSSPAEIPDPAERAQYFPRFGVSGFSWRSRIAAQMSTKLVDPTSRQVITEPGVPGEMAIKSPGIFHGYHRRPDLTQKAFDEEGYFYTGDLFEIAGSANRLDRYRFVGRLKDIIIRGGQNISPEELEGLIVTHPNVAEVAVIGYADDRLGEKICAVVVPTKGQRVTLEEIVDFLQRMDIARYKYPEKLVTVGALPRNPLGKVLKRALRAEQA